MRDLIEKRPSYSDRIRPYVGGQDINQDPRHRSNRYVIYLSDIEAEEGLHEFPELESIVREKVLPDA